ncbi:hypothetical protein N0V84_004019 [Fusarium piperis]|uniref:Uncharacterized protein n=1 Tax=Fusarium piperis TaxID=1435070 RepID=A0A9W9BRM8_9HYPO|nr:hypothetical protein N0V84_004019 [Fusarium piperis]
MQSPNPNIPSGRFIRLILKVLLIIFSIGSFVTFVLAAITAGGDWPQLQESALPKTNPDFVPAHRDGRGLIRRDDDDDNRRMSFDRTNRDFPIDRNAQGALELISRLDLNDPAWLSFFFLSAVAFISWIVTAILLFFVFSRGRSLGSRLPRYIFRVIALIVLTFAPVFIFGWHRNDGAFSLVCKSNYPIGQTALVIAHITLFIGIFLTLLAAILDLPTDFGMDSRRTSVTSGV